MHWQMERFIRELFPAAIILQSTASRQWDPESLEFLPHALPHANDYDLNLADSDELEPVEYGGTRTTLKSTVESYEYTYFSIG